MVFIRYNILILFFVQFFSAGAQLKYYASPLNIPLSLSGNFGELRPDHFHTGLDFRTERKTGLPVYSSAEGSVSRIVVSPTGFGRALYIDHSNNTTTVYGHLLRFRQDIEKYVKAEQYQRRSFAVDLRLPPGLFTTGKQEQIGLSGNSGSSGGPHLHFEIRDTPTQDALNPLQINSFNIPDKTPPRIRAVRFYPLNKASHVNFLNNPKSFTPELAGTVYSLAGGQTLKASGEIGIAIQANDYFDGNTSPCGIFSARLFIDDQECFSYEIRRIPFSLNRYLNSHIDFGEFVENGNRFVKMWQDRGNRMTLYTTDSLRGILRIDSGKVYRGKVLLEDVAGNRTTFIFQIAGINMDMPAPVVEPAPRFHYDTENGMAGESFEIRTPAWAFYEDFNFRHESTERQEGFFSEIHQVHSRTTPLHKPVTIRLRTEGLPDSMSDKALIAEISREGQIRAAGGNYSEGWMETSVMAFGHYGVVCDTLPPEITALSIKNDALTETARIRFTIKDDLSGIGQYTGTIDNQWVLFEYDPKTSGLVYRIDPERLQTGKRHLLVLTVSDRAGNSAVYQSTFWK